MTTVAELVADVAEIMKERPETVNAYARALIDAGDLPKSRGRAIAHVEIEHIVKLVLAVAMTPRIKDASSEVRKYFDMRRPGVTPSFPEKLQGRAGDELCDLVRTILSYDEDASEDEKDFRHQCLDATITITLNWPEIEIHIRNGIIRFKEGGSPHTWDGYIKRTVTISGRAFGMLGVGNGRDYINEVAD
ncbi:hypothetical protein [Marinibacterium sp. SX1]|uniref:hypothetical protein n=1 Tax=Marinibacterium sp. SX1 TaxID=3388424 RepID=UPI003D17AC6D